MLFLKEIVYRKFNFLLGAFGVTTAVAIVVIFIVMTKASGNETRRLTRDMGFNLRIIPESTNMNDFWISGHSNNTMPENYVNILVDKKSFYYAHLTATLHKKIEWNSLETILIGISPKELEPSGKQKSKMIFAIPKGKIYVGYELALAEGIKKGDRISVLGTEFLVERTLAETGSGDDISLYFSLKDLQVLLKQEGQISEIMALNCLCSAEGDDPLEVLREQLALALPNAKVIMNKNIALARERQRKMMDNYFAVLLPIFLIVCAVWIAVISMNNVLQRKQEIGILRALGFSILKIARLFITRALAMGLVGAVFGFFIGTQLAMAYGAEVFKVTAKSVKPLYDLLFWSVFLAPLFAALLSSFPVIYAISRESAALLKEE